MSQRREGDDGPRQPGDGDFPEFPPEWGEIVIPDDLRELAAEAEQIREELRAEAQADLAQAPLTGTEATPAGAEPAGATWPGIAPDDRLPGWRGLIFTRRWRRSGLSGPLVALILMLVTSVASLMVLVLPSAPRRPERAPLATTSVPAGQLGGLLPDVRLPDDRGRSVAVREVRPAVLLLMPADCHCDQVAADLVRVSRDALVAVELVGAERTPRLPANAPRPRITSLVDTKGLLTRAVTPPAMTGPVAAQTDPTAVLVRTNGVITRVLPNLREVEWLRAELAALTVP